MKKIFKFGLGVLAGATATGIAYHEYQKLSDQLQETLVQAVREEFSDAALLTVWIFDDPDHDAIFKGGVVIDNETFTSNVSFEIDADTLEVTRLETTVV